MVERNSFIWGYDTLGETTVIFTAMVGVLLLMGGLRKRENSGETVGETGKPDEGSGSRRVPTDGGSGTDPAKANGTKTDGEGDAYGG